MPPISPTTLFVAGSISITLSPAALVWTMRTVAAWTTVRVPARMARARESLVFIATHFKLRSHAADPFFDAPVPGDAGARLRPVQRKGRAAPGREAAGPCPLHHVPFDRHRLPAAAAAEGTRGLHRRGIAQELRRRRAIRAAGRAAQEPAARDAAGARSGRHRIPSRREALGVADRSGMEDARRLGEPYSVGADPRVRPGRHTGRPCNDDASVPVLSARPLHRVRRAKGGLQLAL